MPTHTSSTDIALLDKRKLIIRSPRIQITWDVGFWNFRVRLSSCKNGMETVKPPNLQILIYEFTGYNVPLGVFFCWLIWKPPLLHTLWTKKLRKARWQFRSSKFLGLRTQCKGSPPNLGGGLQWFMSFSKGCLSWIPCFPLSGKPFAFFLLGDLGVFLVAWVAATLPFLLRQWCGKLFGPRGPLIYRLETYQQGHPKLKRSSYQWRVVTWRSFRW